MKKLNSIMKLYGDKSLKTLLLLLLCAAGMTKGLAYDFSEVNPLGQTLYYNIIDATNLYVEITYPGTNQGNPWEGYTKPTGQLYLPESVTHNGATYTVTAIGSHAFGVCNNLTGPLLIQNSVTSIGESAFIGCKGFSSLVIGNSLTSIGDYAFATCTGFTVIYIDVMVPPTVGVACFYNVDKSIRVGVNCGCLTAYQNAPGWNEFTNIHDTCGDPLNYSVNPDGVSVTVTGHVYGTSASGTITIPETKTIDGTTYTVTAIGDNAFKNCSDLTGSITIPNSVVTIGKRAFQNCAGFTGPLTIGNSVVTIDDYAFDGCDDLTGSLTIPNSVTTIGYRAFCGCDFTGSLTIPNSVTTIGHYAFDYCSGFTGSLTIGNSVTTIGRYVFNGCSGFTGSLIIPDSVTEIGSAAFQSCSGFTGDLSIGGSVTTIGDYAFSGCSGLTSMTVYPVTPPTLGGSIVFQSVPRTIPVYVPCGSLADYQSASGWNSFTNMQETDCSPLTYSINDDGVSVTVTGHVDGTDATGELVIPSTKTISGITYTVTAIGDWAFNECSGLTGSLTIPNSVTAIGEGAFYECTGFDGTLTLGNSLAVIGDYAFSECSGLTGPLTIPNSVTTIGTEAFFDCNSLAGSLTIGNSVISIGDYAFDYCFGFTGDLVIPNSVMSIGTFAFYNCSGFTGSLTIPSSVTTIGQGAFEYCSGFTGSLTIGNSVTEIGDYAFYECSGFTEMTVLAETPPALGTYVFEEVPTTIPVYVPCESGADYQSASGWSAFSNIIDPCSGIVTQTVTLSAGWNWFSTYLEVDDPVTMLQMLEAALGENGVAIKSSDVYTENDAEWGWFGDLDDVGIVNEQMYKIQVSTSCTLNLQGAPAELAAHPITINPGWNWIGFPSTEAMSLDDAFAGFAQEGDIIRNSDGETPYDAEWGGWFGDFEMLEPGQGYMYYSASSGPRLLTFGIEPNYVDLGLPSGLLWATCNVGADTPEGYGDYFAWGETQPKDNYKWSTYKYCNGDYLYMTKYCTQSGFGYNGFTDNLTTLLPEDDAATVNWGNGWRMPTQAEWQELYSNTTWTWTTQNGVNGRLFTASNGNSIFLPAAGSRDGTTIYYAGSIGNYWSRSLRSDHPCNARRFRFTSSANYVNDDQNRCIGHSVRAVRSGNK
jgi:hypothetical protein